MASLKTLIADVEPAAALAARNLTIVPLVRSGDASAGLDYALASQAFERGELTVTEVDEDGVVGQLIAVSTAEVAILLVDGEELVGAKQNRILNTDVLLRVHGEATIPVSCVEQGRWHAEQADFKVGGHSPTRLRGRKARSVHRNLRAENVARSDQGEVWEDVEELLNGVGAASDTDAMAAAYEQRKSDFDMILAGLPYPDDASGVAVFINNQFAAIDLFDRPTTLNAIWKRLVGGYAADAIAAARESAKTTSQPSDVAAILAKLAAVECEEFDGVDLGHDWRIDSDGLVGSALVHDGRAIHLSAFPATEDRAGHDSPADRIASPSRRRRHGR